MTPKEKLCIYRVNCYPGPTHLHRVLVMAEGFTTDLGNKMTASLREEREEGETVASLILIPEWSFRRASGGGRTDSGSL